MTLRLAQHRSQRNGIVPAMVVGLPHSFSAAKRLRREAIVAGGTTGKRLPAAARRGLVVMPHAADPHVRRACP
ncbi:hypothetical protein GTS_06040 [Gandjariella thermophila]|uniref:Uncharacterized protein n=1 Tax=Gandjariella thermophila TaxID=1931992 RepID=A0A4D4IXM7_9PSEU|nr:hypothetical protein GTS_06040 [Gandjariella thermophila]